MTFSMFTAQWVSLKGKISASEHRAIGREAIKRAHALPHRNAPLCFRDLCDRLEVACGP